MHARPTTITLRLDGAETGFAPAPGAPPTAARPHGLLARLRRGTTSGRFIPEVDGLRFVAIASVALFHLHGYLVGKSEVGELPLPLPGPGHPISAVLLHGHIGVNLFFALSGFILALPFAMHWRRGGRPVRLRTYYLRRLQRIEPPYVVSLALVFVLLVVLTGRSASELLPHLLASAAYVHNLVYSTGSAVNYVAWSLEVEVQFYILAPLMAGVFRIASPVVRRGLLVGLALAFLAVQAVWAGRAGGWLELSLLGQGQFFVVGFLLADFYVEGWEAPPRGRGALAWDALSLAGWPLLVPLMARPALAHWVLPFAVLALYTAAFRGRWTRRAFSLPWLTAIGGMCYSIYLLHFQVISGVGRFTGRLRLGDSFALNFAVQAVLLMTAVLVVCGVFYLLVERPCMDREWPARLRGRLRRRRHHGEPAGDGAVSEGVPYGSIAAVDVERVA